MDQAREFLGERLLVAQAPALHRAGLEVFDEDVRGFEQAQQDLATLRPGDVEADRALVAVDADEVARVAVPVEGRAPVAYLVTLRRLEFYHFRPVVGEDHGAIGAAQHAGEVHDAQAGERAGTCRLADAGFGDDPVGHVRFPPPRKPRSCATPRRLSSAGCACTSCLQRARRAR